ncbi:flagellar basal-body MS-ring/collar protein FliF [Paenibacillus tarimensis]|uniref:flagellar basal-body MS-ring/collar protein FliF n=1 Tax=Paenibacillus tarimensis TaxID=416012 RepID=UPI001F185A65|nr:flagellar basal-body MS-ring/collar protein FliF [Paenibacillus tarimensis]MCF2942302.1 flagellar M-ring protein FliF [Paenibacillus tarimensis]
MNEKWAQYRERVSQYWQQFSKKQKVMLGATLGGLILAIILLTYMFSRTEYELAFKGLDAADAAAIMEYLDGSGIPYQLGPDGSSISVPASDANRVKVNVGSQGMVQNGSIGFEEFSEGSSQFGMTDNEFGVRYKNALNGEIQQLLNDMTGVQKSNVLINLPKESVFLNPAEQENASASIMMTFKPGFRPTQEQIDGYYNLVKTAVPNLSVDDITISSQQGELIASSKITGGSALASAAVDAQFQVQQKYEADLKRNIQQFLGTILGQENIVISVTSTMNFDQKTSRQNLVQPLENNNNNGIIISEQTQNSTSTGGDAQGGVAGTGETDVPGYQANEGTGGSTAESNSRTTNYEVSRIQNDIVSSPYVLKDLSIGIGVQEGALSEDNTAIVTSYLTEMVRAQLRESGQNVEDDTVMQRKVSIITQPFVGATDSAASSGMPLAWVIGIAVAVLALAGGAVFFILRKRKRAEALEAEEEMIQPNRVELPTIDLDQVTSESQVRKQLEQLANKKPDEFVNLLRTWLVDE